MEHNAVRLLIISVFHSSISSLLDSLFSSNIYSICLVKALLFDFHFFHVCVHLFISLKGILLTSGIELLTCVSAFSIHFYPCSKLSSHSKHIQYVKAFQNWCWQKIQFYMEYIVHQLVISSTQIWTSPRKYNHLIINISCWCFWPITTPTCEFVQHAITTFLNTLEVWKS